jgi:hypothetical protein
MPKCTVTIKLYPLIVGYTGGFDKHGRAIVYVKIGRNEKLEDSVTYQKLLMYTVERYVTLASFFERQFSFLFV